MNNVNKGLEMTMPFLSHGKHCNDGKINWNIRKRVMLFSLDPAAFKVGTNARGAFAVP